MDRTLDQARDQIAMAYGVLPGMLNKSTTGPMVREAQRHLAQWTLHPMAEEWVSIPLWPELQAEITNHPTNYATYIVNAYGNTFSIKGFQQWFSARVKHAGIMPELQPDGVVRGCTAHGLRKLAAIRLVEAGCTLHEIQAITGHKTAKQVARYIEQRDRERAADSALAKVQSIDAVANPNTRLANSGNKPLKTKEN